MALLSRSISVEAVARSSAKSSAIEVAGAGVPTSVARTFERLKKRDPKPDLRKLNGPFADN